MKTNEISTREQALAWWKSINGTFKQKELGDKFCENRILSVKDVPLTGREIETIWKAETQIVKPNQKQFKQFDEQLFKAYISKFSREDRFRACNILLTDLNIVEELNDALK